MLNLNPNSHLALLIGILLVVLSYLFYTDLSERKSAAEYIIAHKYEHIGYADRGTKVYRCDTGIKHDKEM